ncbi:MAG TPA: sulfurtransferase-like selenium metabolism protein YedF [Firmicutes bacterium]|jgi:selenium metabolism protein YedF|nr:sulfurtransferase-like selenium metabolism protein YedF [Bacillota bacterium]
MQTVDNRGLACPEPVIRTKKALDAMTSGTLVSTVDNEIAKENVLRLANSMGLQTTVKQEGSLFHIEISKDGEADTASVETVELVNCSLPTAKRTTLLVKSDLFGEGDPALGQVLMKSFFHALNESSVLPREIFFVNSAVRLTCQGSPVLAKLEELKEKGVQIFSCGTCLDFYHLNDKLAIGEVTNMFSIVEALTQADNAITL